MSGQSDGRIHEIDVEAESLVSADRYIVRSAGEIRLAAAFWRLVGPT